MRNAFAITLRYALFLIAGIVLGLVVLSALLGANVKDALFRVFGVAPTKVALADNACMTSAKGNSEVYFVSCGGFF